MDDLPQAATWATAAAIALGILWAVLKRRWHRRDKDEQKLVDAENAVYSAADIVADARENGTAEALAEAEKDYAAAIRRRDALRKALGVSAIMALLAVLSGCRNAPAPQPVILNDHVRLVAPGDTVPPLPEGETRWWLLTPRGMDMVSPLERRK